MKKRPKMRRPPEIPPPYPCYFGCGRKLLTKSNREAIDGWEWFTGYGEHPIHFCPPCRRARQFEIDLFRSALNVRPKNYPDERAKVPSPLTTAEEIETYLRSIK